ncbi:MAG: SinI family restriction endonuclease [Chloroflexota bacterium]
MKLKTAIENLGSAKAMEIAQHIAQRLNISWDNGPAIVFNAIINDLDRVPGNIGSKSDDEHQAIRKWLLKYQRGKEGRASKRISNPPSTIADPIIEEIIGARIATLNANDLTKITFAHRLGMSAENILGLILEEYLAENLESYGWYCAWGETVKSVDFVHADGRLLQIKNRSNSENSSSSSVRAGTKIEKWFRIRANRIEYMWETLNQICGTTHLSEESFVQFVQATLTNNPNCLAVEEGSPWLHANS